LRRLLSDPDGRAEAILAICVWVFAAIVYVGAVQLPPPLFDPVGSAAFPKAIAIIIAVIVTLILLQRVVIQRAGGGDEEPKSGEADEMPLRPGLGVWCILIMAGYVGVMNFGILGFREATVPFVVLLGALLSHFRRSTLYILIACGLVIAIGFSWLFSEILYIDLPVTRWLAG